MLSFLLVFLTMLSAQERYIIWHEGELDILLENDEAGLTRADAPSIPSSYLLVTSTPSKVKLSNKGEKSVKVKVLAIGAQQESLWQNLEPETIVSLENIIQNQEPERVMSADAGPWDYITAFYAGTLNEGNKEIMASIEDQMKRRADSERLSVKKVEGVTFKNPLWMELDSPKDIDISWVTRYPITSVCLQIIGQPEPVFKVENLGYYRIQYDGLNRSIKEKILRNRRYEVQVTVKKETGEEKLATSRFFIKKAFDFSPVVDQQFALDKLNFKWNSQLPVTEVLFRHAESRDTIYHAFEPEVIENIHKISSIGKSGGLYQLDISDFDATSMGRITRGQYYELEVAVSDDRGAKRLFSKRYYCQSSEETILKALKEDQQAYRTLASFADPLLEAPAREPEEKVVDPVKENTDIAPVESPEVVQEETIAEEAKESLPKEEEPQVVESKKDEPRQEEFVEKQAVQASGESPVFFYSFDQPIITDQSGNNFNAMGSVLTTDRKGQANQAYNFDGRQDFIALPTNDQFVFTEQTPFTLSFWYKTDKAEASLSQIYQDKASEGSFFLDVKLNNGQLMVWCCAKDVSCETLFGKKPELGKWHHLAITFDASSQLKLFMNGELVRSRTITLDITKEQACAILFGKDQAGQNYLSGGMDDIYLFKRALSPEEIAEMAK